MAFHVACPITCRRICYCSLGFPPELQNDKGKAGFLEEIDRLKAFLDDPWLIKDNKKTVQVLVPKVAVAPPPPQVTVTPNAVVVDGGRGDAAEEMLSVQNKRAAMQKQAAAASLVAEDYARRFESGDTVGTFKDLSGDEQVLSNTKVMCRLCFSGENERSERARKMLSCKSCNKKYHRSCLKSWAHDRDLFHWSSWTCPSCRICEVCRRTGDPNKLMFCKRCDGAYHCYCQHPPHKNVSRGPYLCPKHTRCHSCASTVPGNGSSLRWFLGYTCCDACGRLFVKGNYCPVCLKVYRDSESTPMVCCDICQRWVHCHCDGISDEKYLQFQVNNHLEYRCATCRGECYQVRDLEDAVQELWRRRDKADQDLIANLRAAAGLPTQEEIFAISPYSDEEDDGPAIKKEYGHSLKFSLKGAVDKSPKKSKEYMKKSSNKKYGKEQQFPAPVFGRIEPRVEGHSDAQSIGSITGDNKDEDVQSYRNVEPDMLSYHVTGSLTDGVWPVDAAEVHKHKFVNEVPAKTDRKIFRDKVNNYKHQLGTVDDTGKDVVKSKSTKERKLVIHLGTRNKNVPNSPRSDASNSLSEKVLITPNGGEEVVQQRANNNRLDLHSTYKLSDVEGDNIDQADEITGLKMRGKEGNLITMKKPNPELSNNIGAHRTVFPEKARVSFGKRSTKRSAVTAGITSETLDVTGEKTSVDLHDDNMGPPSVSHSSQKELKPSLRLKFKNVYSDDQSSWASPGEEDKSFVKGQRSKRKRPPSSVDKSSFVKEDKGTGLSYEGKDMGEIMDAKWIIQKLGKHAIGKMVEVHQPSNSSWHKGTVIDVSEDTSTVSVNLDNGKAMNVDLGKQGIRFVSQKHRQ